MPPNGVAHGSGEPERCSAKGLFSSASLVGFRRSSKSIEVVVWFEIKVARRELILVLGWLKGIPLSVGTLNFDGYGDSRT